LAYRKAMVTYLDILGFSELIEKSRKDSGMITKIQNDLISLKTKSSQGGLTLGPFKGEPEQTFYSYNFSDLTVRCFCCRMMLIWIIAWVGNCFMLV